MMKHLDTLSLHEALQLAMESAIPKQEKETVLLNKALGRVLASDVFASKNLPSFDNSAMDGFAFKANEKGKKLQVQRTIFAGEVPEASLNEGECYRIMTGAQLPSDVDTVIPLEDCIEVTDEYAVIPDSITRGSNFRKKGEEVSAGEKLFTSGMIITASDIALLSAQGIMAVEVYCTLEIAVVSTGNEIKEPWQAANEDEIYNANAFGIQALLASFGFEAHYVGAIPDDLDETVTFIAGLKRYDVVITTGGISQGDADFLYDAFVSNGLDPLFHGINLKPGRAVMMGRMDETFVMAMPGNPLTTMLTVHTISLPVLYRLSGTVACYHQPFYAKMGQALRLKAGRTTIVIGELKAGVFTPTRDNKIGSGMLLPLCESNAVAYFSESVSDIEKESLIQVVSLQNRTREVKNRTINL